jgi:predicted enzyme related to lactoylglutathione lyase
MHRQAGGAASSSGSDAAPLAVVQFRTWELREVDCRHGFWTLRAPAVDRDLAGRVRGWPFRFRSGGATPPRWWRSDWPGTLAGMAVSLHHVVIDAHDLPAMARFWAQVLGWQILSEREREVVIGADATAPVGICFMPVRDIKTTKNRLHLDLSPDPGEQEAEIERIVALGARRVDIGQTGAESWTVLADPEGNEFCVVRPKQTLID